MTGEKISVVWSFVKNRLDVFFFHRSILHCLLYSKMLFAGGNVSNLHLNDLTGGLLDGLCMVIKQSSLRTN